MKTDDLIVEPFPDQVDEPAFKLRSIRRVEAQTDEPLLSSALMKCGNTKTLADTVQVSKVCQTDDFSLTCDENGVDPRVIVLKFKEKGSTHSKANRKAGKARAKLVTNACVGQGANCNFTPADFVTESEDAASFDQKEFEIKYLCSYGDALPVQTGSEPRACCKAMTPECLACTEGITVAEYCGRPENADKCAKVFLSSALNEAPSDLFLEAANVKCGSTKSLSNTVDVGKVCQDTNFDLTCDATRTGARVIVMKFKDTALEKPTSKQEKKEMHRTMKARAKAATDLCDAQRDSGSCSFALEDVVEVDPASLVDHVFKVKYLCSYDA